MRAGPVVVLAVLIEDTSDLSFVDRDDRIQALAAKCSDDPFAEAVLPAPARGPGRDDWLQAETVGSRRKLVPKDPITISDQKSHVRVPRQCFRESLSGSLSSRLRRYAEL